MSDTSRGTALLLAAMAAGAALAGALRLSAADGAALPSLLEVHRVTWSAGAWLLVGLELAALLAGGFATARPLGKPASRRAAGLALFAIAAALAVGVVVIDPLARTLADAPASAPGRIAWLARALFARAALDALAAFGLLSSLLLDRPGRRRYTTRAPEDGVDRPQILVPDDVLSR